MTRQDATAAGTIVVGVDGSPASEHAVLWAAEEAHLQNRLLTLVHAKARVSPGELAWLSQAGIPPHQVNREIDEDAEQIVERARSLAADRFRDLRVESVVGYGDARKQLLDLAGDASMVVVGTRGHGPVVGLLLGSVSSALVRHSAIPVAVVRPGHPDSHGVLVAADGSSESVATVELAYREASQRGLPLTVAHCLWDGLVADVRWTSVSATDPYGDPARMLIAETVAGMSEKFPDVPVDVELARGAIDAFLVDISSRYELLVIGRPPRTLGQRLTFSGLTTAIAEHARTTVLVVP